MSARDEEFLKQLLATFKVEADEHLRAISNGLLELEQEPATERSSEIVETIYREAHSLKGAARSVDMTDVESVCQAFESVLSALKSDKIEPSTTLFDVLHRASDTMSELLGESPSVELEPIIKQLEALEAGRETPAPAPRQASRPRAEPDPREEPQAREAVVTPPEPTGSSEPEKPTAQPEEEAKEDAQFLKTSPVGDSASDSDQKKDRRSQTDTVRISVDKLDPLLRQVGEMVSVKLTTSQRVNDLNDVIATIDQWKQRWSAIDSQSANVQGLSGHGDGGRDPEKQRAQLTEFLQWNQECMRSLEDKIKDLAKSAETDSRMYGVMVDDLLEDMMNVLMLPCSSLLEIFPRLVRDLAREGGKEAGLTIDGGDLEIDRRILDEMKEPLIHIVRNCVDHGIETPDERERRGKPRQGRITIGISQISGNQIEMLVSDDGGGIDTSKVREAATRRGMMSDQEKERLVGSEALSLVFRSEVSTSPIISNISGRGLGLAIVKDKVENLGGNVSVATTPNVGTSFRILLPVTLSTYRGILIRLGDELFVVPTANVERVARIKKESVKTVGAKDTIELDGRALPLVGLSEVLELPQIERKNGNSGFFPIMILAAAEARVAFSIDAILQEQEVLVKALGKQLSRVRNVAGATVLGSGQLVPILNVPDLIKSALKRDFLGVRPVITAEEGVRTAKSVLVVEDSITSRTLLKNILESAGYDVRTTVDGADAWSALKTTPFDLVVSDVEMPRMNGFELTANIRKDESLAETPVVLVTSLGSREDRERGIEVGANAYIVKGSFDQNNLLETVERLV